MNVIKTEIEGVLILEPRIFEDPRGYFFESFNLRDFEGQVGHVDFVQDNESKSSYGVVRGLHFQKGEEAVFQYKCDNFYCKESEGAIAWDDPDLGIDWRVPAEDVILSEKDRHHPRLSEAGQDILL